MNQLKKLVPDIVAIVLFAIISVAYFFPAMFVPAGWVQGENKLLHWRTLLCARAIENGLTVLGADQYAPGKFVGHSMAFQPDGTALGELGEEQDLLIVKIN